MKTNTEFNTASCSESGKFRVISLATEFDLIIIYKMVRNKIPQPTWLIRKQFVKLSNQTNSLRDVNIGVPQGSVVVPIHFLIFLNKRLSKCGTNVWLYRLLFAEDTNIFSKDPLLLESNHKNIEEWYLANKLILKIIQKLPRLFELTLVPLVPHLPEFMETAILYSGSMFLEL